MIGGISLFRKLITLATHLCSDWPVVVCKLVGIGGSFDSAADKMNVRGETLALQLVKLLV